MSACRPWVGPRPGCASAEPLGLSPQWPLAWAAAAPLAPWLVLQGKRVRRTTLRLPEPPGPRHGQWSIPLPARTDPDRHADAAEAPETGVRPGFTALRMLLLGDSSMAGVGADHQSDALSGALGHALGAREMQQEDAACLVVQWQLVARTGLRTREMADLLTLSDQAPVFGQTEVTGPQGRAASFGFVQRTGPVDLALVALGVNDATALQSASAFRREVLRLKAHLQDNLGVRRVLWSGLPPMHRFPALPQPLRAVLGRKAIELDAVLHELGPDYLPMPARLDPDWIAADGFHPGPQAYTAWAQQMAPRLRAALTSVRWR